MKDYVIVSDSNIDLPANVVEELGVEVIPFSFTIDDKVYFCYPDEREIKIEDFYEGLKNGDMPVTSQINPVKYQEVFSKILDQGKDVIYLGFSSGLSGSIQSAYIAKGILEDEYEDNKVICVDTCSASIGEGVLVMNAVKKKNEGYSIEELEKWVIDNKYNARHWFVVDDLFHLKRGGRVSSVEAVVGSALKIKPILSIDHEGKLVVKSKARGSKKATEYLLSKLQEEGIDLDNQTVIVGHADAQARAEELKSQILERGIAKNVIISKIGPVIGTHVGSGMLAVVFMGQDN